MAESEETGCGMWSLSLFWMPCFHLDSAPRSVLTEFTCHFSTVHHDPSSMKEYLADNVSPRSLLLPPGKPSAGGMPDLSDTEVC